MTTPLSNMATPLAYAILIQHLHVIYDVLLTLVIGVFLRPHGEPGVIRVTGRGPQSTRLTIGRNRRLHRITALREEVAAGA